MDKAEKKRLKQELQKSKRQAFINSLPMTQELFGNLFDCLDENLKERGCNHSLDITLEFLRNNDISQNSIVKWLSEHGGYCDCEVLANVEEQFLSDAIL